MGTSANADETGSAGTSAVVPVDGSHTFSFSDELDRVFTATSDDVPSDQIAVGEGTLNVDTTGMGPGVYTVTLTAPGCAGGGYLFNWTNGQLQVRLVDLATADAETICSVATQANAIGLNPNDGHLYAWDNFASPKTMVIFDDLRFDGTVTNTSPVPIHLPGESGTYTLLGTLGFNAGDFDSEGYLYLLSPTYLKATDPNFADFGGVTGFPYMVVDLRDSASPTYGEVVIRGTVDPPITLLGSGASESYKGYRMPEDIAFYEGSFYGVGQAVGGSARATTFPTAIPITQPVPPAGLLKFDVGLDHSLTLDSLTLDGKGVPLTGVPTGLNAQSYGAAYVDAAVPALYVFRTDNGGLYRVTLSDPFSPEASQVGTVSLGGGTVDGAGCPPIVHTFTITVQAPPRAVDDLGHSVDIGQTTTFDNDPEADPDVLSATIDFSKTEVTPDASNPSNVALTDNLDGTFTFPQTAVGGLYTWTVVFYDNLGQVSNMVTNEVTVNIDPGIELTKTPNPTHASIGETVTYEFTISNTGNVPLTSVTLTDIDLTGLSDVTYDWTGAAEEGTLGVGETITARITYVLTSGDVVDDTVVNHASVTAQPPLGAPVSATAEASVAVDGPSTPPSTPPPPPLPSTAPPVPSTTEGDSQDPTPRSSTPSTSSPTPSDPEPRLPATGQGDSPSQGLSLVGLAAVFGAAVVTELRRREHQRRRYLHQA
jgi:uncharacterized repeat protein (TIGR01451 family)